MSSRPDQGAAVITYSIAWGVLQNYSLYLITNKAQFCKQKKFRIIFKLSDDGQSGNRVDEAN
ncbi:hypothetical protein GCM10028808_60050 [Spirosoma migulaei]